jgi:peptidoglycan/LPS O-acetylase OafA/YrhL
MIFSTIFKKYKDSLSLTACRKLEYRPDIDGLRAIAILAVVLFHAEVGIKGGYVGVDVFFVISGYLITQILLSESDRSIRGLLAFYSRRVRRILPALLVLTTVVSLGSYFLLVPHELMALGKSLVASITFSSNFLFHSQAGYFDAPSLTKPLLHTWSLSVEAQFYLVFPILIFLIFWARSGSPAVVASIVCVLFAFSLAVSVATLRTDPSFTFYMLASRAWELLAGSILALGLIPRARSVWLNQFAQVAGIICIAWAVFAYTPSTKFPGENAILPVLGTILLIWSRHQGQSAPISYFLERPGVVWLGRISYSLYLWHWPLLVLLRYALAHKPDYAATMVVLLIAVLLSALTYKFVERPFIAWKHAPKPKLGLSAIALLLFAMLIAADGLIASSKGLPGRLSEKALQFSAGSKDVAPDVERCHTLEAERIRNNDLCGLGVAHQPPAFIVWGDSHAHAMYGVFKQKALEYQITGKHASHSACPPLLGMEVASNVKDECRRFNDAMISYINEHQIKNVFLIARWSLYALGHTPDGIEKGIAPLLTDGMPGPGLKVSQEESKQLFVQGLQNTLEKLVQPGRTIYVLEQVPEAMHHIPSSLGRSTLLYGLNQSQLKPRLETTEHRQKFVNDTFVDMRNRYGIEIIRTHEFLCGSKTCEIEHAGRSLYRDADHLSAYGANFIQPVIEPALKRMAPLQP